MISASQFIKYLNAHGVTFFAGVPDSTLSAFCSQLLESNGIKTQHFITANEGSAVGLAIGHHLATGETPCVYMQNSGTGNAVNPLLSLGAPEVYNIPMLLIIGYRGEPGKADAPQHIKQGMVTESLLKTMGIPFSKIGNCSDCSEIDQNWKSVITDLVRNIKQTGQVNALLVSKGAFDKCPLPLNPEHLANEDTLMYREKALEIIVSSLPVDSLVISTTGMTSREVWEIRNRLNHQQKDFLVVGGMGHCSQIALAVALAHPDRPVFCIDGDGSTLMHMGAIALIGKNAPDNFVHVLINNGAHESVGGHPTLGRFVDFPAIFKACGYKTTKQVNSDKQLTTVLTERFSSSPAGNIGTLLLEVIVKAGHRTNLGRPDKSTKSIKDSFMNYCLNKKPDKN